LLKTQGEFRGWEAGIRGASEAMREGRQASSERSYAKEAGIRGASEAMRQRQGFVPARAEREA